MPRKTPSRSLRRTSWFRPSMRPRPDAAENQNMELVTVELPDPSMRPRPDAAENPVLGDLFTFAESGLQ